MPKKHINKIIKAQNGLTPKKLGEIVLDIEEYPNFVPYCSSAKVLRKEEGSLIAEVTISFSIFKVVYTSDIKFGGNDDLFIIELTEEKTAKTSHFRYLNNSWKFKSLPESGEIEIDFYVDFELKNIFLNKAASASLDAIASFVLNAFIKKVKSK